MTHFYRLVSTILLLVVLLPLDRAEASFIRLESESTVEVDPAARKVKFLFTIQNTGDEDARDVELEIPTISTTWPVASRIHPGTSVPFSIEFDFLQLKVEKSGDYLLGYRLFYKDINLYRFSAPHYASWSIVPSPAKTLVAVFDSEPGFKTVSILSEAETNVTLKNIGASQVVIEELVVLSPLELPVSFVGPSTPSELEANSELPFKIDIKNQSALPGSTYAVLVLVSGHVDDRHLAEEFMFRVSVQSKTEPLTWLLRSLVVLVALYCIWSFVRERNSNTAATSGR